MGEQAHACPSGSEVDGCRGESGSVSRRSLIVGLGSTAVLLGLGSLKLVGSESLVRPPGGQDEAALASKCIHCYRCVESCPNAVIRPARLDHGVLNMGTPHLVFSGDAPGELDSIAYCDACAAENDGMPRCVQVCPSTALSLSPDVVARDVVIGTAEIDPSLCIAYRSGHCAFCYDACVQARGEDGAAILYRGAEGSDDLSTRLPVVDASKCNGCGACEAVCVSAQAGSTLSASTRAIVVKPLEG